MSVEHRYKATDTKELYRYRFVPVVP